MEFDRNLIYETKGLLLARYPRFASEIAAANIEYKTNLKYHTAATDGVNIFFDPKYLASLSEDDKLFVLAHELMHIKFMHAYRLLNKKGEKKNLEVWNEATDAIINANLERDGFKIKEGYINRPEALNYSAEEFYQILLKEKEMQNSKNDSVDVNNSATNEGEYYGDDHSMWEEAFKNKNMTKSNSDKTEENNSSLEDPEVLDEKVEFSENRQKRKMIAKENLKRMKEQMLKETDKNSQTKIVLGDIGESSNSLDWKLLLRREIERTEYIWSQRRSIEENNYAYRLEEFDIEEDAETEVMIDVSGSVELDLVRGFLRILKPLLKHSRLKVGCFNEKYWGMTEIKSNSDIDNFTIPPGARGSSAWTEDWDLAVRSFTKKREINKIVFTDGEPCPGNMPKEDLKSENILWLVYGNKDFNPCCGKVINITEEQLERIYLCYELIEDKKKSR